MAQDYYQILGVARDATEKDIRKAYRKLARQFHPDVNPGNTDASERFKKVNDAYHVLNDPKSRRDYDEFGDNWKQADQIRKMGGFSGRARRGAGTVFERHNGGGMGGFNLDDLFGMAGSGGFGGGPPSVEGTLDVTLEEAFHGTTRRVSIGTPGGSKTLEVKVPAGIPSGRRISLNHEGMHVTLTVNVLPHARFRRDGDNLLLELDVPLYDAVLGGEVEVPTMTGRVMLRVPSNTQNGRSFRIGGKGMPVMNADRNGDLIATVRVRLPESLSEGEKALFEQLREQRTAGAGEKRR